MMQNLKCSLCAHTYYVIISIVYLAIYMSEAYSAFLIESVVFVSGPDRSFSSSCFERIAIVPYSNNFINHIIASLIG